SQGGEFLTLAEAGITSLNLAHTLKNQSLANGNTLAREGSFTRADGTTGGMGEFRLAVDTFDTKFAEQIEVPEELKILPNMQGSGNVRELWQAATQSGGLQTLLEQFTAAPTRAEQRALLDQLLTAWADTSGMAKNLQEQAGSRYRVAPISDPLQSRLHALEAFNGQYFFRLPGEKQQTSGAALGLNIVYGYPVGWQDSNGQWRTGWQPLIPPHVSITLFQRQIGMIDQAYDNLKDSVYGSLVMQTRLKPYLDQIELVIDDNGLRLDAARLNQMLADKFATDPENALADLLDLDRYASAFLSDTNWEGLANFDQMIETLPQTPAIAALLAEFKVRTLTGANDTGQLGASDNIVLGGEGDDVLYGLNGAGRLFGQGGDDRLHGGFGNDLLSGGAGNDVLYGNSGTDTYVFGRGFGHDMIMDRAENGIQRDTVRFVGLTPADIQVSIDASDNLTFTVRDTGETLTVPYNNAWWGRNGVGGYIFEDDTVWSQDDALRASVAEATGGDDVIHGSSVAETIRGQSGNDTLIGNSGDDVIDGGAGDDLLMGATGWDSIYENGQWVRAERTLTPRVSDNGNDTYLFGRGDGHDTLIEGSWVASEVDRIELKAGVTPDDVRLERVRDAGDWWSVDDLKLTIRDTGETITVKRHFEASDRYAVEEIVFADGTVWNAEAIKSRVLLGEAGDEELRGFSGRDDAIIGGAGNDTLSGLSGNDVLSGGAGDDVLEGGTGSDTYRFGMGGGRDVTVEGYDAATQDVVELAPGITPADVTVRWTVQGDMAVLLADGSRLTVRDQANPWSDGAGIETLRFADGTMWDRDELATRALAATDGNDAIVGGRESDMLEGGAGDDRFQDLGGDDTYHFGAGDGFDVIEDVQGRILFKAGIDQNDIGFSRDGNDLIVTLSTSGDSIRIKDWLDHWPRIDRFEFANGAQLGVGHVLDKLTVSEDTEILYGSPGDDALAGTMKNSVLYGHGGNDTLTGGAGQDTLHGGDGDDTLDGGADRDWLDGGAGQNTYIVAPGTGLDIALPSSASVADDTVLFAPGIRPEDVSVQLGERSWDSAPGSVGYMSMVVGIGGDDALVLQNQEWSDLGHGAIRRFRFADGTELTLADMITRADGGILGWQQRYDGDPSILLGSQGDDWISDYTGESVTVKARGNGDNIYLAAGNGIVSAGSGDDNVSVGAGNDLIAGEMGDDWLESGDGDDVFVFNHGDGQDVVTAGEGLDTLSYGVGITPERLSAAFDRDGRVVLLVDGGAGGAITLQETGADNLPGDLERIQFIDGEGKARIFDFAGWARSNAAAFAGADLDAPLAFDGAGFELTGTVAPAGGLEAVAYAQASDLFTTANLTANTPTDGDDVLYGTPDGETLDAGSGNDIVLGLAGNDTGVGGEGNDVIHGGDGDDVLDGGAGDDVIRGGWGVDQLSGGTGRDALYGEWGGDIYLYQPGDGEVVIDDDHRVLRSDSGGEVPMMYAVSEGNGNDGSIVDDAPNVLSFGPGIRSEDLRYSERNGDLVIEFANRPNDRVVLRGFDANRETQTRSVDIIRFADGSEIVADSIEPTGRTEIGGDEGGWLSGTAFADTLIGGDGDDALEGNGGADRLVGGTGSDTYQIYWEGGARPTQTVIVETWRAQDANRIDLTGDVNADALSLEFDGRDLLLRLAKDGDVIRFAGFDPRAVGMQMPVAEISLPWQDVSLSFNDLLARGVRLIGTSGNDVLTGTALTDWIEGREGDDTLSGGAGGDLYVIETSSGTDTILDSEEAGEPNVLVLPEGTSIDNMRLSFDNEGFLILDLDNTGNRIRLSGFDPMNPLGPRAVERFRFGPSGDEIGYEELLARGFNIVGTDAGDALGGTILEDRISGGAGNDLIDATPGDDMLSGGTGNDVFVVNLGDGEVTIDDIATQEAGNVLRFGPGIEASTLRNNLRFAEDGNGGYLLLIPYGESGDVVRLTGFNPEDVLGGGHAVDRFEFADGTVVDYATLVSWTVVIEGDNADNALGGTTVGDRLYGYAGDDVLDAGGGDDVLTGGAGNDVLRGAAGRDAYVVNLGDGEDTIEDGVEAGLGNVLTFGAGIARENVRVEVDGNDLLIYYGDGGDRLRVNDYAPADAAGATVIDTFEFADGGTVSLREFMNRAPELANPIGDRIALEDAAFRLTLPDDLFSDAEGDTVLSRVVISADTPLPEWLQYDAQTRTLHGTPGNDDVGEFDVIVQGFDMLGASAFHSFRVRVANTNDAPEITTLITDQQATEDASFSFTVPERTFRDVDAGDALTFSATQADGTALPAWLSFDAASRTFSGLPGNGDVGNVSLRIWAADLAGAQASQTFNVAVANVNDAPQAGVTLTDQAARMGSPFAWQLPQGAFVDIDAGDTLTYSARLADGTALPQWLSFDAATGVFSGTPATTGRYDIQVTASDLAGARVSQSFALDVAGGNLPPVTSQDTASVIEDRKLLVWGNVLANDADPEGGRLSVSTPGIWRGEYGVLTLLSGGGYAYGLDDLSSRVQALGVGESVVDRFTYLASDGQSSATGELAVTVQGTNDAPQLSRALADVQLAKGKSFSWQVPAGSFTDRDRNDTLSYTATLSDGKPLPAWLRFDAATRTFSGTAPTNGKGNLDIQVVASDGRGEGSTASDIFRISFGNTTIVPTNTEGLSNDENTLSLGSPTGVNDAPGTAASAQPRRRTEPARDDDPLARFLEGFKTDAKPAHPALPVLDRGWFAQWDDHQEVNEKPIEAHEESDFRRHWSELAHALNRLDAERQGLPAWNNPSQGADLSGLAGLMQGGANSTRGGVDAVSLTCGSGTRLIGFAGLREGIGKLSC
ncbi:MAG: putative Ig domain-containing protein, partial [Gammaproteobacteria bacterium]|nr:putative Ig domain-containing protein [Gammaproteobacteria bacterium]